MNLKELLFENGEINFKYNDKNYFIACYFVRRFFRKKIEYWFIDKDKKLYKYNNIEELLNVVIDGYNLKYILNDIEIM